MKSCIPHGHLTILIHHIFCSLSFSISLFIRQYNSRKLQSAFVVPVYMVKTIMWSVVAVPRRTYACISSTVWYWMINFVDFRWVTVRYESEFYYFRGNKIPKINVWGWYYPGVILDELSSILMCAVEGFTNCYVTRIKGSLHTSYVSLPESFCTRIQMTMYQFVHA